MLQFEGMNANVSRRFSIVNTAALLIAFPASIFAANLQEEAVHYREEGYEKQQQGDWDGAISLYQKAAALDPAYATPHNDMGVLYERQGQFDLARQAYEHALSLDPDYLEAHTNLAILYERLGNKESAIYHWLKRYELGEANDPWTAHAEERLVALGVLKSYPGLKGKVFTRRRVVEKELNAHQQSKDEFREVTQRLQ